MLGHNALPAGPPQRHLDDHYFNLVERMASGVVSRRGVLAGTLSVITGAPLIGSLARAAESFRCHTEPGATTLHISDMPVWRIDTAWFDGHPTLVTQKSADALSVRLQGGLFPGTSLPADLSLEARRVQGRWQARLWIAALDFLCDFPLAPWLLGYERAVARASPGRIYHPATPRLRACGVEGLTSFGPDWVITMQPERTARLVVDGDRVPVRSVRWELGHASAASGVPPAAALPVMRGWYGIHPEVPLELALDAGTRLELPAEPASLYVASGQKEACVMARHTHPGVCLSWASGQQPVRVPLEASEWALKLAPAGDAYAFESRAKDRSWHVDPAIEVELVAATSPANLVFAASASGMTLAEAQRQFVAARFVVSLSGFDLAVFRARENGQGDRQASLPADIRSVLTRRIPLDAYDLVLRRAADALALTVRFRGLDLRYDGRRWRLVSRSGPDQRPLIEYDFGSQHLLEEAVYLSGWPCQNSASCDKPAPPLVAEIVAVMALRDAARDPDAYAKFSANAPLKRSEVFDPATGELLSVTDLRAKLRSQGGPVCGQVAAFERFRKSDELLDYLGGTFWAAVASSAPAGPTHLTFSLSKGFDVELTAEHLLAWSESGDASSSIGQLFEPELARRAAAEGTVSLPDDADPDRPVVRRPVSLATPMEMGAGAEAATAIEVPARLTMSPIQGQMIRWRSPHAPGRMAHRGWPHARFELWSVRLQDASLRAIHSPDLKPVKPAASCPIAGPEEIAVDIFNPPAPYAGDADPCQFRSTLDGRDRHELVALTGLFGYRTMAAEGPGGAATAPYVPVPVHAKLLQLTSLGANFKYEGKWKPPFAPDSGRGALSISQFNLAGQLGRDNFGRVQYEGFLFPLGHPALLIKLTERRFCLEPSPHGPERMVARLVQRFFIHVPAFTRRFPAAGQPLDNRLWGHASISMESFTTPELMDPTEQDPDCVLGQSAFWPVAHRHRENPIEFEFFDPDAQVRYRAPLIFVDNHTANDKQKLGVVFDHWRKLTLEAVKRMAAEWPAPPNVRRGYAHVSAARLPFIEGQSGDNTSFETCTILLGAQARLEADFYNDGAPPQEALGMTPLLLAQHQPPFYPTRRRARIELSTVAMLSGQDAQAPDSPRVKYPWLIQYDAVYARHGLKDTAHASQNTPPAPASNGGQVFARFVDKAPRIDFRGDTSRSGGFASPSMAFVWLSALRGPVGGDPSQVVRLGATAAASTPAGSLRVIAVAATGAAAGAPADVANAHRGDLDPRELFNAFLGDAKLLGLVKIVDVVGFALAASGTRIPTIERLPLYDYAVEALRRACPIVLRALSQVQNEFEALPDSEAEARLVARIQSLNAKVEALYGMAASNADAAALVAAATPVGKDLRALADEVKGITEKPELLVPTAIHDAVQKVRDLQAALGRLDPRTLIFNPLRDALLAYAHAAKAAVEAELLKAVKESKAAQSLHRYVAQIQADIDAAIATAERLEAAAIERLLDLALVVQVHIKEAQAWLDVLRTAPDAIEGHLEKELFKALSPRLADETVVHAWTHRVNAVLREADLLLSQLEAAKPHAVPQDKQAEAALVLREARQAVVRLAQADTQALEMLRAWQSRTAFRASIHIRERSTQDLASDSLLLTIVLDLAPRLMVSCAAIEDIGVLLARFHALAGQGGPACWNQFGRLLNAYRGLLDDKLALMAVIEAQLHALHEGLQGDSRLQPAITPFLTRLKALAVPLANLRKSLQSGDHWERSLCEAVATWQREFAAQIRIVQEIADLRDTLLRFLQEVEKDAFESIAAAMHRLESLRQTLDKALAPISDRVVADVRLAVQRLSDALNALEDKSVQAYLGSEPAAVIVALQSKFDEFLTDAHPSVPRIVSVVSHTDAASRRLLALITPGNFAKLVNVDRLLADAVAALGLPLGFEVSYAWDTPIQAYPSGGAAIFEPSPGEAQLSIRAVVRTSVNQPPVTSVRGTLSPFSIHLFGKSTKFVSVHMSALAMTAGTGQETSCICSVERIEPGPALGFVNDLANLLGGKSGFFVRPTFRGIQVGYAYKLENGNLAAFQIQNLALSIVADFPFDNSPVRVALLLSEKLNPFLISAGIYGGGGSLALRTRADTLEILEASFEYGVVTAFRFGVAAGSGRITAGIYIRLGGQAPVIEGFFCATGCVRIAGLITVGASLRVTLAYELSSGNMKGVAAYRFDVSIGFFEASYEVTVSYLKEGGKAKKGEGVPQVAAAAAPVRLAGAAATASPDTSAEEDAADWFNTEGWQTLKRFLTPAGPGEGRLASSSCCMPSPLVRA